MENTFWPEQSIVYHLYVRSFQDTNSDGIGDLKGVIKRLDYLGSILGINAIWLSPIYTSPQIDFGYDVSNHTDIDPLYGNLEIFDTLIKEAHKRNIKIINDYIPNHTSKEHPWFLESKSAKNNPKRNWYIWANPKSDVQPPNNWISVFGGSAWEFDEETKQYYMHTFDKSQPDLNWRNVEVVDAMLNVLRFWLKHGVDGFRVDAVYHLFKDENLRDDPINPQYVVGQHEPYDMLLHKHTLALPETLVMMKKFTHVLAEEKEAFMITETYTDLPELMRMYTSISTKWYAPFNFQLISLPWKANLHKNFIDEYDRVLGELYLPTYVLGNHDRKRVATRIGPKQARIAAMLLLTLRGLPFIYYGDEIGMEDGVIAHDKTQDIWEKSMPGLELGRDPERTPMQWNSGKNAGFSNTFPWLAINENFKTCNVETELKDPQSILSLYKTLINFRHNSQAILCGKYSSWDTSSEDIFAYTRSFEDENILVVLNYSDKNQSISLPFATGKIIYNTLLDKQKGEIINPEKVFLRPNEGYMIKLL